MIKIIESTDGDIFIEGTQPEIDTALKILENKNNE